MSPFSLLKLDRSLRGLTYAETAKRMEPLDTETLIDLLDSSSIKVGDTATSFVSNRGMHKRVLSDLINGRFRTKLGKMRALSILHGRGKDMPAAVEAEMKLLTDRSADVVDCTLHGLVFRLYKPALKLIEQELAKHAPGTSRFNMLRRAAEALEKGDPFIYSPGYSPEQAEERWGVRKK